MHDGHDIIVVGASAGGVEALTQLTRHLPPNLPVALFVVLHVPSHSPSVLPNILNRAIKKHQPNSDFRAIHPLDGDKIEYGRIYIAPPDHHLLVKDGYIRIVRGPKENGHRPAVDPLFRTAARMYGRRVVGVVLSGVLDDGTAGLLTVKQQGGVAIAQDPNEALYSGMPRSAIENVEVDYILQVSNIPSVLVELAAQPVATATETVSDTLKIEADMAELTPEALQKAERPGDPSPYSCPECGGVLWEIDDGKLIHFRCRTGHAFSTQTLLGEQSSVLEEALWNALRALEEKAALAERMTQRAQDRNQLFSAQRFGEQAKTARERATTLRELLLQGNGNGNSDPSKINSHMTGVEAVLTSQKSEVRAEQGENSLSTPPSAAFSVIAIAASAQKLDAVTQVLTALPAEFPAAITIVQHSSAEQPSLSADLLNRHPSLAVKQAEEGDCLYPGTAYIAPPGKHLLVNPDHTLSLPYSELVHFARPSADLLFESVAASCKHRVIAVILTGIRINSAIGIRAIKEMGGTIIIQEETLAESSKIPEAAIETDMVDWVVPLDEIATTLASLVTMRDEEFQEL